MAKIAFVFPGQGAQSVGMGQDVFHAKEASKRIFERADEVLGIKLTELIFNGPETELKLTYNTQPALLTASIALYEKAKELQIRPDFVAGHSLGEYSALVAAGVMSFDDAVRMVRLRGEYMDEAVPAGQGAMAAVLGADRDKLRQLCEEISGTAGAVELANLNCPGQIVISGTKEGVSLAAERVKETGAKRAIPLEVSGPFHSSLMKPASEKLARSLAEVTMNPPQIPVVANVTAQAETDAGRIGELLVRQVYSPVLWEDSIAWMIEQGVDTFIEIGPGSVLSGLIKKISRDVQTYSLNSVASIEELAEIKVNS